MIPTCRPELINDFLADWEDQFKGHYVIVVCDAEERFMLDTGVSAIYCRKDIKSEFDTHSWIFPFQSSCIRSYGIWKTKSLDVDLIITLDDDIQPDITHDLINTHYMNLQQSHASQAWWDVLRGIPTRGTPFYNKKRHLPVAISHGGWFGTPDLWAAHEITIGKEVEKRISRDREKAFDCQAIPRGAYYNMCSMNLAWKPTFSHLMYFLLMDCSYPFARLGDIWCGIISKKILDHCGYGVYSGEPFVFHERASNAFKNLTKEAKGLEVNETFWQRIDDIQLTSGNTRACYQEIADEINSWEGDYWRTLSLAMTHWTNLW